MQWYTMDLHIHTNASSDFQTSEVTCLDILEQAETRGLDIISFTDHNTVAGLKNLQDEIDRLELLEKLNRLLAEERSLLNEYRRLLKKILLLPGFEFTAAFGFHILAIFSPQKSLRDLEHLLLDLRIPADQLDIGSVTVGATLDVISAYKMINEAGGLVIAAHANSSNGVAMRGFPFGGQTKISYTQDKNLHALEVTDLELKSRRSTLTFFNGTKPEYPRRMHCIQGSDSHRLTTDIERKKNLGVGDRATEILLPEASFEAIKSVITGNDFARTRPHRHKEGQVYDFIRIAQDEGANIVQDFHETIEIRGGKRYAIIANTCAFANTNGGTLYIGLSSDVLKKVEGIQDAASSIHILEKEISNRITPPLECEIDIHETRGKKVLRLMVPRGDDPPYAVDDSKIYLRSEAETNLAVRDEIVGLVVRGAQKEEKGKLPEIATDELIPKLYETDLDRHEQNLAPRTGVEVMEFVDQPGKQSYTLRDLRNGSIVKNVTQKSARRLWHYAISKYAKLPDDPSELKVEWQGDFALLRKYKQANYMRYDLIQNSPDGYRYYFGVTEDGIHGIWKKVVGQNDE